MNVSRYFIKHPIIAIVLNVCLLVIGILCYNKLPLREYPKIVFPTITVSAYYPNASPDLIESAVTNVLEDKLSGIEGIETISSTSSANASNITLLFKSDIQMDKALSNTQEAVNASRSYLPQEVKNPIVEARTKSNGLPFIGISLSSKARNHADLTHYANLNLKNALRQVTGVASVEIWGQPYHYNVKLDPKKLYQFGINPDQVINAIRKAKIDLPAGTFQDKVPVTVNKQLGDIEDFDHLIIKEQQGKAPIFLSAVASTQLEGDLSLNRVRVNGSPGVILSVNHSNDANPIAVAKAVHQTLQALKVNLPDDIKANIIIDQSEFINASIKNIKSSIFEAMLLVLIIVFAFLKSIKATLIPLVTIPISLIGSFLFLSALGFSINLMTLLAMVLAIGLVVDDAIIVLENIFSHIEQGKSVKQAAIDGSKEITFPIIAMTMTLASVYLPIAFIPGMLGQLFIEFAVALAGSVFISGLVALTLSPVMCAYVLKAGKQKGQSRIDNYLHKLNRYYQHALSRWLTKRKTALMVMAASMVSSLWLYNIIPHETAPKEDRSLMGVYVPKIEGESLDGMEQVIENVEQRLGPMPEVHHRLAFIGDWGAGLVMPLVPLSQRQQKAADLVEAIKPKVTLIPSTDPRPWSWDMALPGISNAGAGARLNLVISTTDDFKDLYQHVSELKKQLESSGDFSMISFDLSLDTPGYGIEIDYPQLAKLNLSPQQVAKAIEVFFSGDRSESLAKDGISYNIQVQGLKKPWHLSEIYLTNSQNQAISLATVAKLVPQTQAESLTHFQQMRSTNLYVMLHKNTPIAKGAEQVLQLAKETLPDNYQLSWQGAVKSLHESSNTMIFLLALATLFIYAILAMQFESFIDPFIILLTVPLAFIGALTALYGFNGSLNIYSQIGLITLIGLITKHGILIVEFANQRHLAGEALYPAIIDAATQRLRPILMTTSAMTLGAIPLLLSMDAGAESRHAIGLVLVSGLVVGTIFTLFILPAVYLSIKQAPILTLKSKRGISES